MKNNNEKYKTLQVPWACAADDNFSSKYHKLKQTEAYNTLLAGWIHDFFVKWQKKGESDGFNVSKALIKRVSKCYNNIMHPCIVRMHH